MNMLTPEGNKFVHCLVRSHDAGVVAAERKRCDGIVGMLWVDLVNQGLADERHAKAFDLRRKQLRQEFPD